MPVPKVLIVDDDPAIVDILYGSLKGEGYQVFSANSGEYAVDQVRREKPDVVLLDIKMPGMDGLEVLRCIREFNKESIVIIMTGYGVIESVIEAIKEGAYDYLSKPFDLRELRSLIKRALKTRRAPEGETSCKRAEELGSLTSIVGKNPKMFEVYKSIGRVVDTKTTVLLQGKTGTGKELVARAIHFNGIFKDGPFVALNCASLPEDISESELFGHEKGSFTGAVTKKLGKFELAAGGTLFLDQIDNLSSRIQAKLLRVVEEKRIERIGGVRSIEVDLRIITASNQDLKEVTKKGLFREDLYYRLKVVTITLPPLRERKDDIPLLVEYFLQQCRTESGGQIKQISPEVMNLLIKYDWPGNVRELRNAIERAVVMGKGGTILAEDLPSDIRGLLDEHPLASSTKDTSLGEKVAELEKERILKALNETSWVQVRAARLLGISRRILRYKMGKYGIERE